MQFIQLCKFVFYDLKKIILRSASTQYSHVETNAKCPKCKSKTLTLIEVWNGATIRFKVKNGVFDKQSFEEQRGEPVRVEGHCSHCDWRWTLRNVETIDEVEKPLKRDKVIQIEIEDEINAERKTAEQIG